VLLFVRNGEKGFRFFSLLRLEFVLIPHQIIVNKTNGTAHISDQDLQLLHKLAGSANKCK